MLLDELNNEQRKVAEQTEGPLLVLAGAGSGKTKAITYRIANLIQQGVKPYHILALTFTNKAAKEMRERISSLVKTNSEQIWMYTFHSFCVRILRKNIALLGYSKTFTIYDDDDQTTVIKNIIKENDYDDKIYQPKMIKAIISDAKNDLLTPDDWFDTSMKDFKAERIHSIFTAYNARLRKSNALDFNDLLFQVIVLFEQHPDVLHYYQEQFSHIHVDEYQDTNYAQYKIVKLLSEKSNNLCVVGDDDQSIYGWRGADISNILDFESDFHDVNIIKLEQNYRSTANILNAANAVIANNDNRKEKALWTTHGDGDKITVYYASNERGEAAWVCDRIQSIQRETSTYQSLAILYRTNAQSRVLEEMLVRAGTPHKVFGAKRFYDRKEVKDVIAYLRVIANPSDDISLKRIINQPKRSIGNSTIDELSHWANEQNITLYETLSQPPASLSSRPAKCVESFGVLMESLKEQSSQMGLSDFVQKLIEDVGLIAQYEKDLSDEAKTRIENIRELMGAISEFENEVEGATLEAYLENVSLVTDLDTAENTDDYVSLMTLHSAKGLEFDTVFIVGMEENIFPSYKVSQVPEQLEEERRLCYVGITRARKKLFLSCAKSRTIYNQIAYNKPSRFLSEIPEELIESSLMERREKTFGDMQDKLVQQKNAQINQRKPRTRSGFGFDKSDLLLPNDVQSIRDNPIQVGRSSNFVLNPKDIIGNFQVGDRVDHFTYGEGNIVSIKGSGKDGRIVVEFAAYGQKTFSLAVVPLRKI